MLLKFLQRLVILQFSGTFLNFGPWLIVLITHIFIVLYRIYGQTSLQPSVLYICPNNTASISCTGRQITFLEWVMQPYFDESDGLSYVVDLVVNHQMTVATSFNHTRYISSSVKNVTKINGTRADRTVLLTIKPFNVINGTNIICKSEITTSGKLFLAGKE